MCSSVTFPGIGGHFQRNTQDVRKDTEWQQKHIGESLNIPLNHLAERSKELPRDRSIVVHCGTGYRSSIAASLLEKQGFDNIIDLVGGFNAWEKCCPDNVSGENS